MVKETRIQGVQILKIQQQDEKELNNYKCFFCIINEDGILNIIFFLTYKTSILYV